MVKLLVLMLEVGTLPYLYPLTLVKTDLCHQLLLGGWLSDPFLSHSFHHVIALAQTLTPSSLSTVCHEPKESLGHGSEIQ